MQKQVADDSSDDEKPAPKINVGRRPSATVLGSNNKMVVVRSRTTEIEQRDME